MSQIALFFSKKLWETLSNSPMMADIENQPQDQHQLHCDISLWSNEKLYMTNIIEICFISWKAPEKLCILDKICSVNDLFHTSFALLSSMGTLLWGVFKHCLPPTG